MNRFFRYPAMLLFAFFLLFSSCAEKQDCRLTKDSMGLWKFVKIIKGEEDMGANQLKRYLLLKEDGSFLLERRSNVSLTANSTVENSERVFYDWKETHKSSDQLLGKWLHCVGSEEIVLESDTYFRSEKQIEPLDSVVLMRMNIQQKDEESMVIQREDFTYSLRKLHKRQ